MYRKSNIDSNIKTSHKIITLETQVFHELETKATFQFSLKVTFVSL